MHSCVSPGSQARRTPQIGAAEAKDNYERRLTVTGTVAQVSIREKLGYLNLGQPFPKSPFAAVIFSRATNESRSAHDGKAYAAVAEIMLLGSDGRALSTEGWKIGYVDSEERAKEDGTAENAIDGQTANFWHTQWSAASPDHPHRLILDMGAVRKVSGFRYTPRQGGPQVGGRIKNYSMSVKNCWSIRFSRYLPQSRFTATCAWDTSAAVPV